MRERSCMASSQWMTAFGRRLFQGCRNRSPSHGIFPGEHMSISPETNVPTHGKERSRMARARVRVPQLRPLIGSGAAVLAAVLVGLTAAPTVSAATNGQGIGIRYSAPIQYLQICGDNQTNAWVCTSIEQVRASSAPGPYQTVWFVNYGSDLVYSPATQLSQAPLQPSQPPQWWFKGNVRLWAWTSYPHGQFPYATCAVPTSQTSDWFLCNFIVPASPTPTPTPNAAPAAAAGIHAPIGSCPVGAGRPAAPPASSPAAQRASRPSARPGDARVRPRGSCRRAPSMGRGTALVDVRGGVDRPRWPVLLRLPVHAHERRAGLPAARAPTQASRLHSEGGGIPSRTRHGGRLRSGSSKPSYVCT